MAARRTLTFQTLFGAGVLALVVAGLFLFMVGAIRAEHQAARQARASDDRIAAAVEEQKLVLDLETGLRGFMITREERFLAPWNDALTSLPRTQGSLTRMVQGDSAAGRLAGEIHEGVSEYVAEHGRPLIADVRDDDTTRDERKRYTAAGKLRVDGLRGRFGALIAKERHMAEAARRDADASSDRALVFGALGLAASTILVILFAGYQLGFVLRPVRRVGSAARRLAAGDLTARVTEAGSGEVGAMGRSFNAMADALEANRDELESQNTELESQQAELEVAVEELAEGKERFERLYSIGRAISSATELEDVARTVVEELGDVAGAELGALYASTRGGGQAYHCVAARGLDPEELPWVRPGVGLAGRALAEGRRFTSEVGDSGLGVESLGSQIVARHEVHLPLVSGASIVGVLTLARVAGGPFRDDDLELLEYLAGRAGAGVSNALTLRTVRDQAALNRAVLETAADAFVTIDATGYVTAWNPAAERLFGWTADEAVGEPLGRAIGADVRTVASNELHEIDARARDGREFPIEIAVTPLERHGELTWNAFIRDISERRRAELYMRAQLAVTRVLSEATTIAEARDGVVSALGDALGWQVGIGWVVDEEAQVLRPTSLWAADGADAAEFLELSMQSTFRRGEPLPGVVWETGEPRWIEDLEREPAFPRAGAAKRAGLHAALSFPVIGGNRLIGLAEFFSHEVAQPDPELLALLSTVGAQIGQFSERKRAELEADRLKDEFFALVSHELRTPLTSIIGYLELVQEDADGLDPQSARFLQVVERNSRRLHRLVGDLLFVAQVEAGRLSLDTDAVPLAGVVADCVEAARPRAEENGVILRARTEEVGTLNGDGDRLGQMLDNLVSNAVKFTAEGGTVDVYLARRGDKALLEVRDSGIGIPDEEQHRLFQRFFRSSTATERAIPGVGLGLTISRAIVEAHGGTIGFESEEGRGTTFRVELPLEAQRLVPDPIESPREVVL